MSDARYQGQVAVITGGASGIGLAIAHRLRQEGAAVSIWDRAGTSHLGYAHGVALDITGGRSTY